MLTSMASANSGFVPPQPLITNKSYWDKHSYTLSEFSIGEAKGWHWEQTGRGGDLGLCLLNINLGSIWTLFGSVMKLSELGK